MDDTQLVELLTMHLDTFDPRLELDSPYDELASGLLSGTLLDDERERAAAILAEQPAVRALMSDADWELTVVEAPETPTRRQPHLTWLPAVAAAVLLGFLLWQMGSTPAPGSLLDRQVAMLTKASPELFRGFRPLDAAERRRLPSEVQRGGIDLLAPRGAIRTGRPTLRWRAPAVGGRYQLRVRAADGTIALRQTVEGTMLAWPQDVPSLKTGARYVWRVEALDQSAVLVGAKAFHRLTESDAERYADGLTEILALQTPEAPLLAAHWAIRFALYPEARTHLERAPKTEASAETLEWLRAAMGE